MRTHQDRDPVGKPAIDVNRVQYRVRPAVSLPRVADLEQLVGEVQRIDQRFVLRAVPGRLESAMAGQVTFW